MEKAHYHLKTFGDVSATEVNDDNESESEVYTDFPIPADHTEPAESESGGQNDSRVDESPCTPRYPICN